MKRPNYKRIIEQLEEDRSFMYQFISRILPTVSDAEILLPWACVHFEHTDDMIVALGGESYRDCYGDADFMKRVEALITKES